MTRTNRIVGLDGLRGIAAVAVVLFHTRGFTGVELLHSAYLSVDLFFLISGFVMAHVYEKDLGNRLTCGDFFIKRLRRIYPLYLVGLTLGVVAFVGASISNGDTLGLETVIILILAVFFIPTMGLVGREGSIYPLNGPSWSLAFELIANYFHGFIARWLSFNVLLAMIALSAISLIVSVFYFGSADIGMTTNTFVGGLPRVFFSYFLGVLIFRAQDKLPTFPARSEWLLLALVAWLFYVDAPGNYRAIVDLAIILVILPLLVFAFVKVQLNQPIVQLFGGLGTASYALYVIHLPALKLLYGGWGIVFGGDPSLLFVVAVFVPLLVVSAYFLTKIFDEPVQVLLKSGAARVQKLIK